MSPRGGPRPNSGRPRSDPGTRLHVRASPEQLRVWTRAAEEEGRDLSTWVRRSLDEQAARVLEALGGGE